MNMMANDYEPDLTASVRAASLLYPEIGTGPVPSSHYTSAEGFELEREKIFKKYWLFVGTTESLKKPGDYFVHELEIARTSIIITKGRDQVVRAFHNVCKHRANRLASGAGNCKYFTCLNHGWAYNTKGELAVIPDESQFHDLDRQKLGLTPVQCEVWRGLVFINLDPKPQRGLLEQLGGFAEQFKDYPFEAFRCGGVWSSTLRCNWKVFQDIFQEAYHVSTVHSGTFPTLYSGPRNPGGRPGAFKLWGENHNVGIVYNPDYEKTDIEKISGELGTTWTDTEHMTFPGTNWSRLRYYNFDLNSVFPNMLLNPGNGFMFSHRFWPISVNETRWMGTLYFLPAKVPSEILSQEQAYILIRDAWREDLALGEKIYASLESGVVPELIFSDAEIACRHSYETVSKIINS